MNAARESGGCGLNRSDLNHNPSLLSSALPLQVPSRRHLTDQTCTRRFPLRPLIACPAARTPADDSTALEAARVGVACGADHSAEFTGPATEHLLSSGTGGFEVSRPRPLKGSDVCCLPGVRARL